MNKVRSILFGSLLAGSLALPAGPALARVEWRDLENTRARLQAGTEELARNRRQLDLDIDRGASSYQIDRDRRAVEKNLDDIRRDREILRRDLREYSDDRL
jgi:hypothetical protein